MTKGPNTDHFFTAAALAHGTRHASSTKPQAARHVTWPMAWLIGIYATNGIMGSGGEVVLFLHDLLSVKKLLTQLYQMVGISWTTSAARFG